MAITIGISRVEAQVTIGGDDAPATGSVLSLNSDTKGGLLLSNVYLDDLTKIPVGFPGITSEDQDDHLKKDFIGAVVYNTNGLVGKGKGIYVWSDIGWNYVGGGTGSLDTGRVAYRNSASGPITGWLEFMTYNLGATPMTIDEQKASLYFNVPASYADETAASDFKAIYGDMYQWGRNTDGHEKVWSTTYNGQVPESSYANAGNEFKIGYADWLEGGNSKQGRWGGETADTPPTTINYKGENDPCPPGFRVPSTEEWQGIVNGVGGANQITSINAQNGYKGVNKWKWQNGGTATISGWLIYPPKPDVTNPVSDDDYEENPTLFLPAAGWRYYNNGNLEDVSVKYGYYWSSTSSTSGHQAYILTFNYELFWNNYPQPRSFGQSIRCVREH
ncbi:MAG: fibrobacter succinogenes major paralogous domain-containing protein [Flavobacteriaceae bacterium]|nr:fibrobacter succinogenes major paralogous domain-containing protein [Flavobacteriaceae bacterium]